MKKTFFFILWTIILISCTQIYVDRGEEIYTIEESNHTINYTTSSFYKRKINNIQFSIDNVDMVENTNFLGCQFVVDEYKPTIQNKINDLVFNLSVMVDCNNRLPVPSYRFYYFDWSKYDAQIDLEQTDSIILQSINEISLNENQWKVGEIQTVTTSIYDQNLFELPIIDQNDKEWLLMAKEFNDVLFVTTVPQTSINEIENFYEWNFLSFHTQELIFKE